MSDAPLFQNSDDQEQAYAPEELADADQVRVRADHDAPNRDTSDYDVPSAAPVANVGNTPTGTAAPPNIGHHSRGGASGDPESDAGYPIGDEDRRPGGERR